MEVSPEYRFTGDMLLIVNHKNKNACFLDFSDATINLSNQTTATLPATSDCLNCVLTCHVYTTVTARH